MRGLEICLFPGTRRVSQKFSKWKEVGSNVYHYAQCFKSPISNVQKYCKHSSSTHYLILLSKKDKSTYCDFTLVSNHECPLGTTSRRIILFANNLQIDTKTDILLGTKLISLEPIQHPITHRFRLDTHRRQNGKKLQKDNFCFFLLTFKILKCEQHNTDRKRA